MDANVVVAACSSGDEQQLRGYDAVAPAFMWAEARSAVHEAVWRGEVPEPAGRRLVELIERAPVRARTHRRLAVETWRLAEELGWAKTYDAEYVALAQLLNCRLVTLDARLRRGADRLGIVVLPTEL